MNSFQHVLFTVQTRSLVPAKDFGAEKSGTVYQKALTMTYWIISFRIDSYFTVHHIEYDYSNTKETRYIPLYTTRSLYFIKKLTKCFGRCRWVYTLDRVNNFKKVKVELSFTSTLTPGFHTMEVSTYYFI